MIKGVLIFGAGIGVGYGIAVANNEEALRATTETLTAFRNIMNDAWLDVKLENATKRKKEAEAQKEKIQREAEKELAAREEAKTELADEETADEEQETPS